MNSLVLSRLLGWFSLGLGAVEVVAPRSLSRLLGLHGEGWLLRAFGFREIAAGLTVLGQPDSAFGPSLRVVGDVLDLAVLAPALSTRNDRRVAAHVAFVLVLGVTALDVMSATTLVLGEQRRAATAERTRVRHSPTRARTA